MAETVIVYERARRYDVRGQTWRVTLVYGVLGDRVEAVEVRAQPVGDHPVTRDALRAFPVGQWIAEDRPKALSAARRMVKDPKLDESVRERLRRVVPPPTRRRPSYKMRVDLERVATIYREAFRVGDHPTRAVADALHIARSTAAKKVQAARAAGHLGPTAKRRAGI